jgi:hypothetical protein
MQMSTSDEGHPSGDLVRCLSHYSQLKQITFKKWGDRNLVPFINILILKNPQINQCAKRAEIN